MGKAHLTRLLQIAAAIIVVVLAIGLYRAKSDAAKTQAHVRALQTEIGERQARLRELRAEIAEQESPGAVEQLAEQHLDASIASQAQALPEEAIADRLPAPRPQEGRPH
jgi:cell division protein FtsL